MTLIYSSQDEFLIDEAWSDGQVEWAAEADYWPADFDQASGQAAYGGALAGRLPVDGVVIVAVVLILFFGIKILADLTSGATTAESVSKGLQESAEGVQVGETNVQAVPSAPTAIIYPYDNYTLTQGPHGFSYGHMAIDIAAGKGAAVKSPIEGKVSNLYIDQWGNTTLVIENGKYQVTMLHGDFTVSLGENVALGQQVGTEGNNGYTLDMYGNSCRGRDCGHHTHLNVFDKELGTNVNPLNVLSR